MDCQGEMGQFSFLLKLLVQVDIRNSNGHSIKGFVFYIRRSAITDTEPWAIYEGLQMAWKGSFKHVKVKSDNLTAIKFIESRDGDFSAHLSLLQEIRELMTRE